jgi:hypothetical protein
MRTKPMPVAAEQRRLQRPEQEYRKQYHCEECRNQASKLRAWQQFFHRLDCLISKLGEKNWSARYSMQCGFVDTILRLIGDCSAGRSYGRRPRCNKIAQSKTYHTGNQEGQKASQR